MSRVAGGRQSARRLEVGTSSGRDLLTLGIGALTAGTGVCSLNSFQDSTSFNLAPELCRNSPVCAVGIHCAAGGVEAAAQTTAASPQVSLFISANRTESSVRDRPVHEVNAAAHKAIIATQINGSQVLSVTTQEGLSTAVVATNILDAPAPITAKSVASAETPDLKNIIANLDAMGDEGTQLYSHTNPSTAARKLVLRTPETETAAIIDENPNTEVIASVKSVINPVV